jgi:hypothetical protein
MAYKRNRFGFSISWSSQALNAPFRKKISLTSFISRKNRTWFSGATSISIAVVIGHLRAPVGKELGLRAAVDPDPG